MLDSDIDEGAQGSYGCCPIAIAVRRATKAEFVKVDYDYIFIGADPLDLRYVRTPKRCVAFMSDFDFGVTPAPFSFDFQLPRKNAAADDRGKG